MLKNYLVVAFRNLKRNKIFSLINVAGLAIGISAALVIYLIVRHELSYDKFHHDGNSIYRVVTKIEFKDLTIHTSGVPVPTAATARAEIPGIDKVTHFITSNDMKVSAPGRDGKDVTIAHQKNLMYADSNYFNLFNYTWLAGLKASALTEPYRVVLTKSRAEAYFGNIPVNEMLDRKLVYNDSINATVSGIVMDLDKPTDLAFREFISKPTISAAGMESFWEWEEWGSVNSSSQMLIRLKKGATPAQVRSQLAVIREKYREKKGPEDAKDDTEHFLQALADIHFNPDYDAFEQRQAHRPTLFGLAAVGVFLLLLGCINFINLTTAQASQRAREIGIRKTMGSSRRQITFQFLAETFLLTTSAAALSVVICPWLLEVFSDFIPPGISFKSLNSATVWLFMVALVCAVTLLAGFYPALVLTRFRPVTVLKNQAFADTAQTRKAWLRKTLTVAQFMIAQFLIIATIVVGKQVKYSVNKDLGFKKDAIVSFNVRRVFPGQSDNRRHELLEKLRALPGIEMLSMAGDAPASTSTSSTSMTFREEGKKLVETMVEVKVADTAYFNLFGLKLIAGRQLLSSDTTKEFIINETFARMLGFDKPGDAVGHFVERRFNVPIVGVVSDFHAKSTHHAIKPLAYSSAANSSFSLHLALPIDRTKDWTKTLASVESIYNGLYPDDKFNYAFYDERIAGFYKTEQNISRLLRWSAGLCIFISCLGLLGLVIYITNARIKEIGVRKVLGASVLQIVSLLSKDFVSLVLVAFLITLPIAWWTMQNWLKDFAYRTDLDWWVFASTGIGTMMIAAIVLSIRTIRSAMDNPVKALRSE